METLHRLAGVQDPSPYNARDGGHDQAPQPVLDSRASNDDNFSRDRLSQQPSRATLPLNHKTSQRSIGHHREPAHARGGSITTPTTGIAPSLSSRRADQQLPHSQTRRSRDTHDTHDDNASEDDDDDDFPWGPTHPCFPHPNPHCLPDSDEAKTTRVIRVRRDWLSSGDRCPQFANLYPDILDSWVTLEDFRSVISTLNQRLESAFDPMTAGAWVDAVLGVATGFLWDDLGLTTAKRQMKDIEAFVNRWNADKARERKAVKLIPLRKTGFMSLDFVIPDLGLDGEHPAHDVQSERPMS